MDWYLTVTEEVLAKKEVALHRLLQNLKPHEQLTNLSKLILAAVKCGDEPQALSLLSYATHAIDDTYLLPLCKEKDGRREKPYESSSDESKAAHRNTAKKRAYWALSLYRRLPKKETRRGREYSDESFPTLLKLKKELLKRVVDWMFKTSDDSEAVFLMRGILKLEISWNEEKEVLQDVLRELNDFASLSRLGSLTLNVEKMPEEVVRIFGIAYARNRRGGGYRGFRMSFKDEIGIINPLEETSPDVVEFMQETAKAVAKFHTELEVLIRQVQPEDWFKRRDNGVDGKISIHYSSPNKATIVITQTVQLWNKDDHLNQEFEHRVHMQYEMAKSFISTWLRNHPGYQLGLCLTVANKYQKDEGSLLHLEEESVR